MCFQAAMSIERNLKLQALLRHPSCCLLLYIEYILHHVLGLIHKWSTVNVVVVG